MLLVCLALRLGRRSSLAIFGSALIRVLGPWFRADLTATMLATSATLWAVAFLIYVVVNARALVTARPDGKPG